MEMEVQSQTPDCLEDYVAVYDVTDFGGTTLLKKLCNADALEKTFFSSWEWMHVLMYTDNTHSGKGFLAHYLSKTFAFPENLIKDITFDGT